MDTDPLLIKRISSLRLYAPPETEIAAREIISVLIDTFEGYVPERKCSCHISAPCGDCTEHWHERDILATAKAHLKKVGYYEKI